MIATILPSSSDFHAIRYNESKVKNGSAVLLEMKNFGFIQNFQGYRNPEDLIQYLQDYSSSNTRIKKTQFHIAFSCKGNEMSYEELLDFAHQYLNEMGYGKDGQPLLVYAHSDTENNHIHVITSRVDPNGRKINDSNERRRSQKVIEKLLGKNEKQCLEEVLFDIKDYNYRSLTQYRAILEALGYECYEKNKNLHIKKGGIVLKSIDTSNIINKAEKNVDRFDDSIHKKLFGIFSKYKDLNSDLDGFRKDMRKKFGLELVFFGKKDSPYGYAIVDFKNKCVYEGSKVMGIKRLNDFITPEERKNKIDIFISDTLEANPNITQKEMNKKLKKINAYISKGMIYDNGKKYPLNDIDRNTLEKNDKLDWVYSFHPQNNNEFELLLKFAGLDKTNITYPNSYSHHAYNPQLLKSLQYIFSSDDMNKIRTELDNAGFRLIRSGDRNYIYSSQDKALIDLNRINIRLPESNIEKLKPQSSNINIRNPKINMNEGNTHGINREWEVGTKGKWDEVDDGSKLKY